jgi:hypothetical protein
MKHFLYALMPGAVDSEQHIWKAWRSGREQDATTTSDQLIDDHSRITTVATLDFLPECDQCWVSRQLSAQVI